MNKNKKAGLVDVDQFFSNMPLLTVNVDGNDAIRNVREATLPLTERVTVLDQFAREGTQIGQFPVIQEEEGEFFIYDRESSTGTYVRPKGRQGFRPVGNAYKLQHGDTISLGSPAYGKRLQFKMYEEE